MEHLFVKYADLINEYYKNDGRKIYKVVDEVLKNLCFHDIDKEDFYSLADEIFIVEVLAKYDDIQDFGGFLYTCLYNKFCTYMTKINRKKRRNYVKVEKKDEYGNIIKDENGNPIKEDKYIPDESIYQPIGDDENSTLGDIVAGKLTIEKEFFGEKEEGYSKEMQKYLGRLSPLQKEVLRLISIGFTPNEILKELHINQKLYEDCYNAIHSQRNTSILL